MRKLRGHDSVVIDIGAQIGSVLVEAGAELWHDLVGRLRSRPESEARPGAMTARQQHDTAVLRAALDHPSEQVLAVTFLAQLYCYEACDEIARLLDAESPAVRSATAQALGRLDGWAYRDRLRAMAEDDPSAVVRRSCLLALAWMRDENDKALFRRNLDDGWAVRGGAVAGLGALEDVDSLERVRERRRRDRRHPTYIFNRHFYLRAIRRLEAAGERRAPTSSTPSDPGPFLARVAAADEVVARLGNADDPESGFELAWALIDKGNAFGDLGRLDEASAALDEVVARFDDADERELQHAVAAALHTKAWLLASARRLEEAVVLYEAVVARLGEASEPELRAEVVMARVNEAVALDELERDDEALAEYEDVVRDFGDDGEPAVRSQVARALLAKAFVLGEHRSTRQQLYAYDELVARFGESDEPDLREYVASALGRKARDLIALRRNDEALQALNELLERFGDSDDIALERHVSDALRMQGSIVTRLEGGVRATTAYDDLLSRFGQETDPEIRNDVAYGLLGKAAALGEFHRLDEAAAAYDELISRYGGESGEWIESLVHDARIARKHLDRWWWRLLRGL